MSFNYSDNELQHFGIKGMKWGVRRYQNKDGSLTEAGKKRYDDQEEVRSVSIPKEINNKKLLASYVAFGSAAVAAYNPATAPVILGAGTVYLGAKFTQKMINNMRPIDISEFTDENGNKYRAYSQDGGRTYKKL